MACCLCPSRVGWASSQRGLTPAALVLDPTELGCGILTAAAQPQVASGTKKKRHDMASQTTRHAPFHLSMCFVASHRMRVLELSQARLPNGTAA